MLETLGSGDTKTSFSCPLAPSHSLVLKKLSQHLIYNFCFFVFQAVTELSRKIVQYVQGRVIINKAEATDEYMVLSMKCKTDTQEHGTTVPPLFKHKDLQKLRSSVEEQNNGDQELTGKNE